MKINFGTIVRHLYASLFLLWIVSLQPIQAALSDYTEAQQQAYGVVAAELSIQNGSTFTAESIEAQTYWVDAVNGKDEPSQSGKADQPWKSILWAMYNVPFDQDEANIVVKQGTYTPAVLFFDEQRGGKMSAPSSFNLLGYPGEQIVLDGRNVTANSALVSISGAQNITISGIEFSNVLGSGKSVIYITDSNSITLSDNNINNAKWTTDAAVAESPTLADRLNAIAVVGQSTNIMIKNNILNNLVTGYGDPILVASTAQVEQSNNAISDVDASTFSGQRYYVSTKGDDDSGIGSIDKPWLTIRKALFTIPFTEDDATILIRGGTYKISHTMYFDESRGGSNGKYFTVKSYRDEEVIIDGSLLTDAYSAMASFSSTSYVRLKGLTFANLKGPKSGIYIEGASHHIRIMNNTLRDMTWADGPDEDEKYPKPSDNLNPIAVIGNHATQAINNIFIRGNQLANIVPGYSEGIKIVGNVTDFVVSRNHIHNIANIGIVAAGNYTWVKDSSDPSIPLDLRPTIPAEVNHARNGIIRNNIVHNAISPVANSAGIYLDGARNVTVRGNTSYNNSVGFSVGSEQPGDATGNTLRRNIAYGNTDAGLVVGTTPDHPNSYVNDTTIINNEFRDNYTRGGYGGELTIQTVNGLEVNNNLFSSRSDVIVVVSQPATNLSLNKNLYYGASNDASKAVFDWGGITGSSYIGLSQYQAATCNDLGSMYQDAKMVSYLNKIKGKAKSKSKQKSGGNKVLREIKRACYKGNKVW